MPVCMVWVKLAITCVHDYIIVIVKVTKICGKMNLERGTLVIAAVPPTLTSEITKLPLTLLTGYLKMIKTHKRKLKVQSIINGLYIINNIFDRKHTSILAILNYGVGTIKVYGLHKQYELPLVCGSYHPSLHPQKNELCVICFQSM